MNIEFKTGYLDSGPILDLSPSQPRTQGPTDPDPGHGPRDPDQDQDTDLGPGPRDPDPGIWAWGPGTDCHTNC